MFTRFTEEVSEKRGAHDLRPSAGPPDSCAVSGTLRDRVETSAYETIRLVRGLADKVSQGHEEPVAGAEAEAECLLWDRVQKPKGGRAEVYFRRFAEAR